MNLFREHVNIVDPFGNYSFPKSFSNEIYFANGLLHDNSLDSFDYVSNFSIKYVFEGCEKYIINGKYKEVKPNSILAVNNRSEVTMLKAEGRSLSIFLSQDILSECFSGAQAKIDDLQINSNGVMPEFCDEVISVRNNLLMTLESRLKLDADIIIPIDYYYELGIDLIKTQNTWERSINRVGKIKRGTRIEIFKRLMNAKNFLDDTITEKFNLTEVSNQCCLSKFQLIRNFKSVFGVTPHRYFITRKLAFARNLLLENKDVTVREVASMFGYPDIFSFSKQFKQIYGLSPTHLIEYEVSGL